jgi:CRISPR-associated protein Cas5, N-terminal domain
VKALRIILRQNSASYRKEETVENKMTYPLPPASTVIGALHSACNYTEPHPMDISIQGKYESMKRKAYIDHCFLNSLQDDRNILVKMCNNNVLSTSFEKVATAKKSQGNSFRNNVTIQVHNQKLLEEYQYLKNLKDQLVEFKKNRLNQVLRNIKNRKKTLAEKRKKVEKGMPELEKVVKREIEIKAIEKMINARFKEYENIQYTLPISRFRTLVTSLKFYEILYDIELVLHVKTDVETLQELLDNIYNLKSIGRSEDYVNVIDAQIVELQEEGETDVESNYAAYIGVDELENDRIFSTKGQKNDSINGTKYYLNINYKIENGKRKFKKEKVVYLSKYAIDELSENVCLDRQGDIAYIVTFLHWQDENSISC